MCPYEDVILTTRLILGLHPANERRRLSLPGRKPRISPVTMGPFEGKETVRLENPLDTASWWADMNILPPFHHCIIQMTPTGTRLNNNVIMTWKWQRDVVLTSWWWRYFTSWVHWAIQRAYMHCCHVYNPVENVFIQKDQHILTAAISCK